MLWLNLDPVSKRGPMTIVGAYVSNIVATLVITTNYMHTPMGKFTYSVPFY